MKDQRKTEIKVGVTVIAGLIIFLWILGWAKNFSLTSSERTLKIRFSNASGLEVGDYISVNGVREGNVESIRVDNNGVLVAARISNNVDLRKDAVFGLAMTDLMGGKKIDIKPGISQEPLDYSVVQKGVFYYDIPSVMAFVGSMQDDLVQTLKDVKVSLNSLNNYLTDKKMNKDIRTSIANLAELTGRLNSITEENKSNIKKLVDNSVQLTSDAKDLVSTNKSNITATIDEAKNVLQKTDSLVTKLNGFADEIKSKDNNIGKIVYDDKLYNDLKNSIKQVNELTKILIEQLTNKGFKVDAHLHLF